MMSVGNLVVVTTQAQFEKLLALPTSISGWFSPSERRGEVLFASPAAAVEARRAF